MQTKEMLLNAVTVWPAVNDLTDEYTRIENSGKSFLKCSIRPRKNSNERLVIYDHRRNPTLSSLARITVVDKGVFQIVNIYDTKEEKAKIYSAFLHYNQNQISDSSISAEAGNILWSKKIEDKKDVIEVIFYKKTIKWLYKNHKEEGQHIFDRGKIKE